MMLESVPTVLTQPGTPVSFRGMCICSLFDFRKLRNFPMFSISGKLRNSDVSDFWKLRTPTFFVISHSFMYFTLHLWLRSFPLFHVIILAYVLRSLSVPGTSLFHSLAYKYLYSIARIIRIKITIIPTPLVSLVLSFSSTRYSFSGSGNSGVRKFPRSLELGNPGSLRDSTGNRAIPWVHPGN